MFFIRDPLKFPISFAPKNAAPTAICATTTCSGTSGHCPRIGASGHLSDGRSRHSLQLAAYEPLSSHTYMWVNTAGERFWVKYHFRTDQGIQNLTQSEADELVSVDTDFHTHNLSRRSSAASARRGRS